MQNDSSVLTRKIEELEARLAECRWAEEELEKYKILFENISDFAYICDNKSNILYVNKTFSRLTGHKTENFIGRSFPSLFDEENLAVAIENFSRTLNGESPQFELCFKDTGILCEYKNLPLRNEKGEITGVIGTARDITERKKTDLVLRRRDSVLEAIRFLSEELLETSSLETAFEMILRRLGEAIDVSRAYIFENHTAGDGSLLTSQRYEWVAPGVLSKTNNADLEGLPYHAGGFSKWVEAMERGETIQGHISEFPESEKSALATQEIKSLVAVPIFVDNRWWGFIGFDECADEREWAQVVIDALKAAAGAIGLAMQRRMMEEKLKKTAMSLAEAQRLSRIGSWEWDIVRNETHWSDGLYQIFGIEPGLFEKNAYEAFLKCVHPEDRNAVMEATQRGLTDKKTFNIEYRIIRPDAEVRHIYARGEVFCDGTGAPIKVLGTSQDITERKIAEEALRKSQRSLANAQRLARVGSWDWDIAANDLLWSDEIYSIFGIEKKGFGATYEAFLRFIHPDDRKSVEMAVNEALYEGKPYYRDHRIVRPDGMELIVHEQAEVEFDDKGLPVRMSGTVQDITERKIAEEQLKESEEKFRAIFENSNDGLLLADPQTLKFYLGNKKICQMIGYSEEELRGKGVLDIYQEKDFSFFIRQFEEIRRGSTPFAKGVAVKRKDGSVFYADISNSQVMLAGKNFVLGAFRDVTERKRTEDELNRYKSNLEAIFRSVREAIISIDLNLSITEVNEAARDICGISRADIGLSLKGLTRPCSLKCLDAIDETILMKKPVEVFRLECGKINKHHQTVALNTYPLIDSSGSFSGVVLVISDETRLVDLERDLGERKQLHNIIGKSDRVREIFHLIENLADIDTTVLITGESGTGKEVAAEALHYTGIRSNKPLVKVNCSAIPEYLLESELFGHVKGAFTGAVKDRTGRFELADGGTIFLDEIGDISPEMQLRLLRVIQEKEFERLGDSKTIRMDVRVIAATNKDLAEKVKRGGFREDLYYRLKVVELMMPPLRDRLEDIPLLEDHFLKKFSKKFKREIDGLSPDVHKIFMNYPWPGNIRELEHAFEHAFIVCRHNFISVSDLPPALRDFSRNRMVFTKYNKTNERDLIVNALEKTAWNKQKAARILGVSRTTLYRKIEKYRLA